MAESPAEVKFDAHIPDSTSGTIDLILSASLVFVNPRFVRQINSPGACTKDAHSATAAWPSSSAEQLCWPAAAAFFRSPHAPHSTHDRSTHCARSPAHNRGSQ